MGGKSLVLNKRLCLPFFLWMCYNIIRVSKEYQDSFSWCFFNLKGGIVMDYMSLIIVAILIEAMWENLKMIWQEGKFNVNMIGVLLLSILVCILSRIDIFPIVGITLIIPYIGSVLTGIIISRGANFVNDLFSKLKTKGE